MRYILYKKKYINGKKRRLYKKEGSNKLYLKHKGRMLNVVKYKKYIKKKRKSKKKQGGFMNMGKQNVRQRVGRLAEKIKEEIENNKQKRELERVNREYAKKMSERKNDLNEYKILNNQNKIEQEKKRRKNLQNQRRDKTLYGHYDKIRKISNRGIF